MATISNAAIFPSPKLSNPAPRSRICFRSSIFFKPMSSNLEKTILITAKSFSQQPNSVNPLFNPVLDAHEGSMFLKPMSSNLEKSILITAKTFTQRPTSVKSLFNPILDAHEDAVVNAKPILSLSLFEHIPEDREESMSSLRGASGLTHSQYESEFIPEIKMGYLNGWTRYGRRKWLVLLLEDPTHTEELVSTTIPVIFPCLTAWNARALLEISRQQGYAVVIVAARLEHAEFYVQEMRDYGLRADFVQSKK